MDAQATAGLLAIGAAQDDLRPRFIKFAADFFAKMAQGEKPPKPDPTMAEITAQVCAATVGAEVPMPLQPTETRTYTKRAAPKEPSETEIGHITVDPAARPMLEALGLERVMVASLLVMSAFLKHPNSWLRAGDIAAALGKRRDSTRHVCAKLREAGALVSEGERVNCKWKLAEMPPRV